MVVCETCLICQNKRGEKDYVKIHIILCNRQPQDLAVWKSPWLQGHGLLMLIISVAPHIPMKADTASYNKNKNFYPMQEEKDCTSYRQLLYTSGSDRHFVNRTIVENNTSNG